VDGHRRLAAELDLVSWDCYPTYHDRADTESVAAYVSFVHDINRGMKAGRPFLLMESCPSAVNWMGVNKLLRPGIHRLKSLQAVAQNLQSYSIGAPQWIASFGMYHGERVRPHLRRYYANLMRRELVEPIFASDMQAMADFGLRYESAPDRRPTTRPWWWSSARPRVTCA